MNTDQQLKALFPKLLPGRVEMIDYKPEKYQHEHLRYIRGVEVRDTELLFLCREVKKTFTFVEWISFADILCRQNKHIAGLLQAALDNDWQQEIQAAAEVRGIL